VYVVWWRAQVELVHSREKGDCDHEVSCVTATLSGCTLTATLSGCAESALWRYFMHTRCPCSQKTPGGGGEVGRNDDGG
jgi:hypothetical protein